MKRFAPSLLLFTMIVVTAPAISQARDFLFTALPGSSVQLLIGAFAVVAMALFVLAIRRISADSAGHRGWRYAGLVVLGALLWFQAVGFSTKLATVNAVEKVHVIEYGLLGFLLYRALRLRRGGDPALLVLVLSAATVAGAVEEGVQWLAPLRTGDIRDVAINATSAVLGLLFGLIFEPLERWSWRLGAVGRRYAARATALTLLVLGLFFGNIHLGYEIEDPEIGRFRSRWSAEELRSLAAERRREWALDPPTGLEVWAVEDYFLTEAAWHVRHRNICYRDGCFYLAWQANRILEKYYGPFLDIESFRDTGLHRYPASVRAELAAKKGKHDPSSYLSRVSFDRIRPWPKGPYYAVLAALVLMVWSLGFRRAVKSSPISPDAQETRR